MAAEDGNVFVKRLLTERRQRLVGTIMREAEATLFPAVSEAVRKAYRQKVLEAVGSYHDVVLDCMRASIDDGTIVRPDPEVLLAAINGLRADLRVGRG